MHLQGPPNHQDTNSRPFWRRDRLTLVVWHSYQINNNNNNYNLNNLNKRFILAIKIKQQINYTT